VGVNGRVLLLFLRFFFLFFLLGVLVFCFFPLLYFALVFPTPPPPPPPPLWGFRRACSSVAPSIGLLAGEASFGAGNCILWSRDNSDDEELTLRALRRRLTQ